MDLITIFIKAFIFAAIFDNPVVRLIIGLLIISLYIFYFSRPVIAKKIKISAVKLENPIFIILLISSCFISIISVLLTFRIFNIGNEIDLILLFIKIVKYLITSTYITLLGNLIYYMSLIILIISILSFIKKKFYFYYYRIHIYLLYSKFYKNYISDFFCFHHTGFFYLLVHTCFRLNLKKSKLHPLYDFDAYQIFTRAYSKWFSLAEFLDKYFATIIMLLSIFYDLIVNSFILHTIFYVLPIAYLYFLWTMFVDFYKTSDVWLDQKLYRLLYVPYMFTKETNTLSFIDGEILDNETYISLIKYMLNNFRYSGNISGIITDVFK